MFAKRGVPNGTRKRQNTGATAPTEGATTDGAEGDPAGDSGAPKEGSSESEGEHAKIFQKKWVPLRQQRCKHVILGRVMHYLRRSAGAVQASLQYSETVALLRLNWYRVEYGKVHEISQMRTLFLCSRQKDANAKEKPRRI